MIQRELRALEFDRLRRGMEDTGRVVSMVLHMTINTTVEPTLLLNYPQQQKRATLKLHIVLF